MKSNLGIIAGEGKFPILIAKEAKAKGMGVFIAGASGNAKEEDFKDCADKFAYLKIGQLGGAIRFFKENGVTQAVMAGRVQHFNIFSIMPDLRAAKVLASLRDMRPSSILQSVVDEFEKEGIKFAPSHLFLEKLLPKKGLLTKRAPTDVESQSITLGYKTAKTLADLDAGLTCVICDRAVVALEGMEGTDNCILRAGQLYDKAKATKESSLVVVKVARPKQDDRYDLPVIGKGTIKAMMQAKAKVLAFEAGKTLILDLEEVLAMADKQGITITGI